jgi:hypothetical protein
VTLTNVTISGNHAQKHRGGGIFVTWGTLTARNTILWGNTALIEGPQVYIDSSNSTADIRYSVVESGCPAGSICSNLLTADPMLGVLGDHGGGTQTMPLNAGSSAIDAGEDATCTATDQRGVARPQGSHCDIGAYEAESSAVGPGTYDDTDPAWVYTGSWTIFASSPAYNGGIHYTTTVDNSAELMFTGSQFSLIYTGNTNRGPLAVYVDGVQVATIDQYTSAVTYQKSWTSGVLGAGVHRVKFVHAGSAGLVTNIDAIEIFP